MIYRKFNLRLRASGKVCNTQETERRRRQQRKQRTLPAVLVSPELQEAYTRSRYRVENSKVEFVIGAPTRLHGAVLGAWNPGSRWQSEYRNRKRDQRLLRKLGGQYYQAMWGGTDAWWERHFWVPGLTFQRANRLAYAMGQKAFLFLNGQHVLLIWCYT